VKPSPKITSSHLSRSAIVYVRQSTLAQVRENTESTTRQYAAAQLGIPADAIYNWLIKGQVPARRAPGGRWCIPWDPRTQPIYRDKVAKSFRLKPTNLAANGDPGSDATHRDDYGR
jgi:hypothetical protein